MMVFLPKSIDFNTVSVGVGMGTPATTRAVYVSKATLRGLFVGTEMGGDIGMTDEEMKRIEDIIAGAAKRAEREFMKAAVNNL